MALKNYILNGPRTVILADGRDPFISWKNHITRAGRGGVDLVAPIGTPVYAPTDGVWTHLPNNGTAGNSGIFTHDDNPGWADVFSHLSAYVAAPGTRAAVTGQHFKQGEMIGRTGISGGVAPHLHRHLLDPKGVRRNPWLYFTATTTSGSSGTPLAIIPTDIQKQLQLLLRKLKDPETKLPFYGGPADGVMGQASWGALQRYMQTQKVYAGADDGIPGVNTYKGLQLLAKRGGYTGPIDGIPGAGTYAGLRKWLTAALAPPPVVAPPVVKPPVVVVPPPVVKPPVVVPPTEVPTVPIPIVPKVPVAPAGQIFGVDVGTSQAAMDFKAFAAAGGKFAIVKMGGGNASDSPYTAPKYRAELDAARAAGLKVGHYWFNGQKVSVAVQAQYFADTVDLREGEVLALDVEAETASGTRAFTPAEVLEFMAIVRKKFAGVKFLIYMSAGVTRNTNWAAVAAADTGLWVAAYNTNNGLPGVPPIIGGWDSWVVWQYTSVGAVPGFNGDIDHNFAIANLFGAFGYAKLAEPEALPLASFLAELKALIAKYE